MQPKYWIFAIGMIVASAIFGAYITFADATPTTTKIDTQTITVPAGSIKDVKATWSLPFADSSYIVIPVVLDSNGVMGANIQPRRVHTRTTSAVNVTIQNTGSEDETVTVHIFAVDG